MQIISMARETMSLLTASEPLDFDKRTISRQPSVGDIEMEGFLRGFNLNYEDTVRQRIDDDRGKSHELGQSTVKCMRGILQCWIRQANRVELFKQHQSPQHALHSKFHLDTGDTIYEDADYSHLQIDVVSLYLIFLVQMTSSGLQIIYTQDEVNFIQNLVYYVERAYRTPDYGMWERGSKYNDGTAEIHASSIGMAKAALEAINGYNLFGDKGASWSVIFVDIDAHNRNRSIFETLLPRESSSKEKIVKKLKGEYGFKRFLRDGYKSVLEDPSSRFYSEGKTIDFENIECEWPIFYLFMVVDGVFKGLPEQVEEFCQLARQRLVRDANGDPIVPMYFFVPKDNIELERQEPGSQFRHVSPEGSASNLFLWGQSMYVIAQLLTSGLVHVNEIDLVRRYLPSYNRPRRGGRYSAFQGIASDLVVQVVLIAESQRLQAMMATYGIQTQTPHEVEPVQIWPPSQLVKVYEYLGVNKKLGLKGRPSRPVGALGTSKVYRVCGQTVLCYPLIFEVSDFYLSHDMALLIDDIKTELHFVGKYWRVSGRPTMILLIREEHMRDRKFSQMLDLFAELKKGHCDGLKVRIGRLQNLLSSSCIEHLDFMNLVDPEELDIKPFRQVVHEYSGYQSLTDVPKTIIFNEPCKDYKEFCNKPTWEILEAYKYIDFWYYALKLACILVSGKQRFFLCRLRQVQPHDIVQAVLQQETALYCGKLIVTNPELFEGILKIRMGWILHAIVLYKENATNDSLDVPLEACSPSEVRRLLEAVLSVNLEADPKTKLTIYQKRQIEGCLCRVPSNFYARVWHVLRKTPGGIIVAGKTLPQEPTLKHMTLSVPVYSSVFELLDVVSTILQRNPELAFKGSLDIDKTVASAFKMFQKCLMSDFGLYFIFDIPAQNKLEDNKGQPHELYPFFNASTTTTTGYLARAVC
ncbi:putative phosphorylase b kinase regulatory subunit beta [Orchesella cincta]|uniref:Phosphorylase b kinase regulatory subunit n=1 Tax=Orchesella cincta TaxID=48709 RepID=A0A1D2NHI6_ORCCI|nr:putative phosphorylase b kinase regulatory subunit beta [Orchesella cincta]